MNQLRPTESAGAVAALPMLPPPPLVAIRDLWVELGGFHVLRGVNADVARGKVTGLIGLNGSGKTTLLRAVVGEYPYRGRISFHCGHDHSHPTPEYVGYVPQRLMIDARLPLTVRDLFSLALSRHSKQFDKTYISLIKASEQTGSMGQMLETVATYLRSQLETRQKIRAAMAYPAVMAVLAIAAIVALVGATLSRSALVVRYLSVLFPLFMLLVAIGVASTSARVRTAILVAAVPEQ